MVWYEVINKLKDYGAKIIAFDVIFSEPELSRKMTLTRPLYGWAIADFQAVKGNKVITYYLTTLASTDDDISYKEIRGPLQFCFK